MDKSSVQRLSDAANVIAKSNRYGSADFIVVSQQAYNEFYSITKKVRRKEKIKRVFKDE